MFIDPHRRQILEDVVLGGTPWESNQIVCRWNMYRFEQETIFSRWARSSFVVYRYQLHYSIPERATQLPTDVDQAIGFVPMFSCVECHSCWQTQVHNLFRNLSALCTFRLWWYSDCRESFPELTYRELRVLYIAYRMRYSVAIQELGQHH